MTSSEILDHNDVTAFAYHDDGQLWCEEIALARLKAEVALSCGDWTGPLMVYSRRQILANVQRYRQAIHVARSAAPLLDCRLGYSLKANATPALLRLMAAQDTFAVTVSGNEVEFALRCGFPAHSLVLNGNGKQLPELELAVSRGCMINVDADFDVTRLAQVAERQKRQVSLLLRLNPNVDTGAHPYNCTGAPQSKFGVESSQVPEVLRLLEQHGRWLQLVGLHCHIGSNVADPALFVQAARLLLGLATELLDRFPRLRLLNLGGGWGIDYLHDGPHPSPGALLDALAPLFADGRFALLLEPGRSIMGPAGLLLTDVIGLKSNGGRHFVVVNAAMTEVLRPALYGAHQHISLVDTHATSGPEELLQDVVGPVCESGDFLAQQRRLPRPLPGSLLAVWDTGAYCSVTSSNYNLRGKTPEVLVDGEGWTLVRRPQYLDDLWRMYE